MFTVVAVISLTFLGLSKLSNFKLAGLKDLLLQHCNTTMTMPVTFVSDCGTETCTEAKEKEHCRKHEQATCVPITFIDGAMINLIKTQMENTLKKWKPSSELI